ncbi:MAG: DUF11 domain-containing protein, partial [Granulosicoccus sp.]|nr:DUF11 domain-containing protein [Granulosicoccus sp.]
PAPTNADEDGSGDVSVGDTLTYTITATNDGTANLTNVVVSDPLLSNLGGTQPCALVAPAGTCTLTGDYVVTSADVTAGSILNTGTANSDQTDPVTDDETVPVPTPSLAVNKPAPTNADEDGSGDVSVGDTLTYTITATNDGTANLTNVVVSDPMITPTGGTTPCALASTETCTLIGTYVVTSADVAAGQIDNTGTADSDQTDPVTDEETVPVPTPSLNITKSNVSDDADGSGDVSIGDTITYTFSVENTGGANLTNVTVNDDKLGAATLSDVAGDGVGFLAAGDTETATLTYVIVAGDLGSSITNIATADSTQTDPDTDTNTVVVPYLDLKITKTFNPDLVLQGEVGNFTIEVTNIGTAVAQVVNVTDTVDELLAVSGVSYMLSPSYPNAVTGACDASLELGEWTQNIDCTFDTIQPGQSVTVTVTYTALPGLEVTPAEQTKDGWTEFYFVFKHQDGTTEILQSTTRGTGHKNDFYFENGGFNLHLSCSDQFTGGWGDTDGPSESANPDWQVAFFSIIRYKKGAEFKTCGDQVLPLQIDNEATVTSITPEFNPDNNIDDASVDLLPGGPLDEGVLTVVKSADEDSATVGDTITYSFDVGYLPGQDGYPATNIAVVDPNCDVEFSAGDSDQDGRLDGGETWHYTCAYVVPPDAVDPIVNTVTVTGTDLQGDPVTSASDSYEVEFIPTPTGDLQVTKSANVSSAWMGDLVTYSFDVTYTPPSGSGAANSVMVDDAKCDAPPTFINGDDNDNNMVDSGETWNYTCNYTVPNDAGTPTASVTGNDVSGTKDDWREFEFVFMHTDGTYTTVTGSNRIGSLGYTGKKNDAYLPDAGGPYAMDPTGLRLHVSCSDSFEDGWGSVLGPDPSTDHEWRIASYAILKYQDGKVKQTCIDSPVPSANEIVNTVTVTAVDAYGPLTASAQHTMGLFAPSQP